MWASILAMSVAALAAEPITLSYWGNEWDALSLEIVQDFETRHDGRDGQPPIRVLMGQSASINKVEDPQRLITAVAGGDPPDVVWFDRFAVAEWAARGAFVRLQPFVDRDLAERADDPWTLHPEQFYEPAWDEALYEGALYAVPADIDNRAMFYNLDLLEKHADALIAAGCVNPNDPGKVGPPQTWKQLRDCARILTEHDSDGRLRRAGFIPKFGNSWLYMYGWLNGGEFMSADGKTCTLNAPEIVGALAYMTDLYDAMGGAEAVSAFESTLQGGDLDPFLSGKVAMKIDCSWFINFIANQKRDLRFGVALPPAPEGKKRLGWCGGWSWAIPKGTKHPEEAWTLIKYMASRRSYEIRADAMRQAARAGGNVFIPEISGRRDITEWAMERYLYSDPTIEDKFKDAKRLFVDTMSFAKYRPVTPVGQLLWNAQVRGMDAGIYKYYDRDDTLRNALMALDVNTAVVQKELDRIYHPVTHPVLPWRPLIAGYLGIVAVAIVALWAQFRRRVRSTGFFRREYYAGYLFAGPWLLGFVIFGAGPILVSLVMSLCEYDVLTPPRFVGLANYIAMAKDDPLLVKSLGNTVYMALGIPLGMAVSLGIALLLNYEIKGMAVYRTFFYLPAIMPAVAASILWFWIFNAQEGILNVLLARAGIHGPAWLQDRAWAKPALILMGLWGAGGGMIVWLAGLKSIPRHLYEAAEIDGAGRLNRFVNITLPMLSPYILFNLIMGLIGTFQIFTHAYIMTQGGPVDSTLFYAYHLFNNAFRYMKMGYASALAWLLFAIVLALTAVQLRLSKNWVHYESDTN